MINAKPWSVIALLLYALTACSGVALADDKALLKQARELNAQGISAYKQGDYPRAIAAMKQSLTIKKNILGERHPSYAVSLSALADFYRLMGDWQWA